MTLTLHVSPALFGDEGLWGGGERFALELARAQAARRPTRLLSFGVNPHARREGDLQVRVLRPQFRYRGEWLNPISFEVIKHLHAASIVHVHHLDTALTDWIAFWCKLLGRRVFVTDLGGHVTSFAGRFDRTPVIERHLALSTFAAERQPGWRGRSTVIGAGIDPRDFSRAAHAERRETFVFLGRLMPYKGIDVLLRALPEGAALEVYGRPYHPAYFDLLRQLAGRRPIRFVTDADDEQVRAALARARALILPSIQSTVFDEEVPQAELFGLVLIEAMALGTPVVASDFGPTPEIVREGVTGHLFPPGDTDALRVILEGLRADDERWSAMSRAARADVLDRFTWDAVTARCFAAYDAPPDTVVARTPSRGELARLLRPPRSLDALTRLGRPEAP